MIEQPHQGSMGGSDANLPLQTYQETARECLRHARMRYGFSSGSPFFNPEDAVSLSIEAMEAEALTTAARTLVVQELGAVKEVAVWADEDCQRKVIAEIDDRIASYQGGADGR